MGFADLIRGGVALANDLTGDLQVTVQHFAWISQNGDGEEQYASPVSRQALVDRTRKEKYTGAGRLVMSLATVTFLEPFADNGAATRTEPVDPRDKIVLSDGATAPIVEIKGFEDSGTNRPFFNEVTLGEVV